MIGRDRATGAPLGGTGEFEVDHITPVGGGYFFAPRGAYHPAD